MLKGRATKEATQLLVSKFPQVMYNSMKPLGNIFVSRIGAGGFRWNLKEDHERALEMALDQGINLIDTSNHFGSGNSEILVGKVLQRQVEQEKLLREV